MGIVALEVADPNPLWILKVKTVTIIFLFELQLSVFFGGALVLYQFVRFLTCFIKRPCLCVNAYRPYDKLSQLPSGDDE